MLRLTIAGRDCTALLQAGSLTIVDDLTGRGTCSFLLVDYSADPYDPIEGSHVLITDSYGRKRFAGQIDRTAREIMPGRDRALKLDISCLSYSARLDRYVVTGVWYNATCKQILQDVFAPDSTYCEIGGRTTPWPVAGEGIIVGDYVQDGPVLEKVVGNYQSAADLLDELTKIATFKWFVDYDKQLHFFSRETATAAFEVRDHTRNARKIAVTRELEQYRNQQLIRGGTQETTTQTETFVGDGEAESFVVKYEVSQIKSITVNGQPQIVAIAGTPGAEWHYRVGSNVVSCVAGAPATGATISVSYIGTYSVIAISSRDTEIGRRRAIEGGPGLYQHVETDEGIEAEADAALKAEALLELYGTVPRIVEYETDDTIEPKARLLRAGQLQTMQLSAYRLGHRDDWRQPDQFAIHRVEARDVGGQYLAYRVRAIGSDKAPWVDFFRGLAKRSRRMTIREDEVVLHLRSASDPLEIEDTLDHQYNAAPALVGEAEVGFSEICAAELVAVSPWQRVYSRSR